MTNKNYDINTPSNEAEALQQLLRAVNSALCDLTDSAEAAESHKQPADKFTITIADVQTVFTLGAPQYMALLAFIKHIADENLYLVDFDNCTVTG